MTDTTRAATILGGAMILAAGLLVGGLAWVIHSAVDELSHELDQARDELALQLRSLSTEVSRPIERMFHDPVPIRASDPLAVSLPQPLTVGVGDEAGLPVKLPQPVQVGVPAEPVPIDITGPVTVRGRVGDRDAVPVETDVNLFGGGGGDDDSD